MESVLTFKRGIDPKEAMDIGEVHFLKSNIGFLQDHPAIVSLYTENKDNETVVIGREAFLFTGRLIHILIDVSKTTSSDPGKFLIEYLPAKYFSRVDAYDWSSEGGESFDLGEIKKLKRIFRFVMYIKEEYTDKFPDITNF